MARIHAHLREGVPVAMVLFQRLDKSDPGGLIFALGGEEDALGRQIGEDTEVVVALMHPHLIDPTQHTLLKSAWA